MKPQKLLPLMAAGLLLAGQAEGALALSQTDGATPVSYSNGGGTGFGGTLGAGSFTFDANGANLDITFTVSGSYGSNIVALYLDTRAGGFSDATMNDTADAGRNVITNLGSSGDETFPTGMTGGLPDFGIAIGSFGTVLFELTGGSLNFIAFNGTPGVISVPLASLGDPTTIDWFAALSSDTNFLSNESLPQDPALNGAGNPGFGATGTYSEFNRFVTVPEPAAALLGSVGLLAILRRRRK